MSEFVTPPIRTQRLLLLPGCVEMLRAELQGPDALSRATGARVPEDWPPDLYDEPAVDYAIRYLEANPRSGGWTFHYFLLMDPSGEGLPTLVGVGGFKGEPTADGTVEVGYSIVRSHQRRGLATEAVLGFLDHAFADPRVRRVIAETLPDLTPSIGVLEKVGMRLIDERSQPEVIRFEITRAQYPLDAASLTPRAAAAGTSPG